MNEGFRHEPAEDDVKVEAGSLTSRDIGRVVRYPDGDGVLDQVIHDGEDVWIDLKSDSANFSWDHRYKPDQSLTLSADKSATTITTVEEVDTSKGEYVEKAQLDLITLRYLAIRERTREDAGQSASGVSLPSSALMEMIDRLEDADAKLKAMRGVLIELVDPDPCHYDHSGDCQAHGFPVDAETMCPHEEAKEMIVDGAK